MSLPSHVLSVAVGFDPIGNQWVFDSVSFDQLKPYNFGQANEGFPVNAEEGLRAICLLALQVKRARLRDLSRKIPKRLRAVIDPYWNSKAGAAWPGTLFGENPWANSTWKRKRGLRKEDIVWGRVIEDFSGS